VFTLVPGTVPLAVAPLEPPSPTNLPPVQEGEEAPPIPATVDELIKKEFPPGWPLVVKAPGPPNPTVNA
jgi:hypothetical protein